MDTQIHIDDNEIIIHKLVHQAINQTINQTIIIAQ